MASKKVAPLWEGGYQTVHTAGKAAGGSLIVCVCDGAGCGGGPPVPLRVGGKLSVS